MADVDEEVAVFEFWQLVLELLSS